MSRKDVLLRSIRLLAPLSSVIAPPLAARWLARLFATPMKRGVRPREKVWMSSARRSALRFDSARTLPVYTWGDGPPVLLAHGWSSRASQLGVYVAPLVEQGFQVVAFDQTAHPLADAGYTPVAV